MKGLRPPVRSMASILVGRRRRSQWVAVLLVAAVVILGKMALLVRDVIALAPETTQQPGEAAVPTLTKEPVWPAPPEPAAGPVDPMDHGVDLSPANGVEAGAVPSSIPPVAAVTQPDDDVAIPDRAPDADLAARAPIARLDPANLTPSEIEVLQELAERRAQLDQRAAELDQRAVVVEIAEARLEAQLERLGTLHDEIAALIQQHDADEEAELESLVKIYETMKPKAAAEIFDRLELSVLLEVVSRMREASSAEVLARMDPGKAERVTAALAARVDLLRPGDGG